MGKAILWTTRDGQQIPIKDMVDSHLLNTVRMMRRNCDYYRSQLARKYFEEADACYSYRGGEYAEMAAEADGSYAFDRAMYIQRFATDEQILGTFKQWKRLKQEIKKRGLVELPVNLEGILTNSSKGGASPTTRRIRK